MQRQRNQHTNGNPAAGAAHAVHALEVGPEELTEQGLALTGVGPRLQMVLLALGALFAVGVVGFVIRLSEGFDDRSQWGYTAAVVSYLLTTGQSAVLVSVGLRLAKGHWRRPIARAAEIFAVVGLLNLLLLIPLVLSLPSGVGRNTLWLVSTWREGWPPGAPHAWDFITMAGLVVVGLALLYTAALPDFAAGRDHSTGWRQGLYARLAWGFRGTPRQWKVLRAALGLVGAFYFIHLVFTHTLLVSDFALGLVPGWKDSIMPPFHALSGIQAGLATVVLTAFFLRRWGGLREYITVEQFWSMGKLLLALSLLWAYFWWAEFITFWYGRLPSERQVTALVISQTYFGVFVTTFFLNFLVPAFGFMVWNPFRKSIVGPTLAATSILIGTFLDRVRLYVASFSVENSTGHMLEELPATQLPDGLDVLIVIGAISGALLLYLLASRVVPVLSIWEMKELLLLRRVRRFLRRDVVVLGKPE